MGIKNKAGRYQMRAQLPKFVSDKNPFGTSQVPDVSVPEPKKSPAPTQRPRLESPKASVPKPEPPKQTTPSLFDPEPANAVAPATSDEILQRADTALSFPGESAGVREDVELTTDSVSPETQVSPQPKSPPIKPATVGPHVTSPVATSPKRGPVRVLVGKLNPFDLFKRPGPKPAAARLDRRPVQTELSLERVKVVRNDLTDADLEVVTPRPVKSAKGLSLPAPPAHAVPVMVTAAAPERTAWGRLSSRLFGAGQTTQTH